MTTPAYRGQDYLSFPQIETFARDLAAALPQWVALEDVGESRGGRALLLLTLGDQSGAVDDQPAFWLDGGTHAPEWTGVMAALFSVSRWAEQLASGDGAAQAWFRAHTVYCMPCISPDGLQAMFEGQPFLRSVLRPPKPGEVRSGFEPRDIDGDGAVRWMRWKDPAGPFIADPDLPLFMRPRRIDDDPADAWFLADEGEFLDWDGVRWSAATRRFGLDLNRNYPEAWRPFSMFGMDSGAFPLSEPESRAVVDSFAARRNIACALTNHTYTGALLTAPARVDDPLGDQDVRMLELLADDAVDGTHYRVIRKHPDFTYDPKNPAIGCWDDCLCNTFGVAGYTLELWDPFRHAGVDNLTPAKFFMKPDPAKIRALIAKFAEDPEATRPWQPFDHPQLGPVEIGGIDYMRTMRNPPVALLEAECERGYTVADRLRRALPRAHATATVAARGDKVYEVRFVLENRGFLPTGSLAFAEEKGMTLPVSAALETPDGVQQLSGTRARALTHMDGWGTLRVSSSTNALYPSLPSRGNRAHTSWLVRGKGAVRIAWQAGRAGRGQLTVELS